MLIDVTNVPEGTEVSIGKTIVGTAPGLVQLERSDDTMVLTFNAPGHQLASRPIVPDKDKPLDVGGLKKKRVGGAAKPATTSGENPDGLIHVFGEEKKKR